MVLVSVQHLVRSLLHHAMVKGKRMAHMSKEAGETKKGHRLEPFYNHSQHLISSQSSHLLTQD